MKKIVSIFAGFVLILLISPYDCAHGGDTQYWSQYKLSHKLTDKLSLFINPSFRVVDDVSDLRFWKTRQGLAVKLNDHWKFNVNYFYAKAQIANSWIDENRVEFQPMFSWKMGEVKFLNRVSVEFRMINGDERWRFRNKIKMSKSVEVFKQKLTVFVDEEGFYDQEQNKFNQNRASVGFGKKISNNTSIDIFYLYKSDKVNDRWIGKNVIGSKVMISL